MAKDLLDGLQTNESMTRVAIVTHHWESKDYKSLITIGDYSSSYYMEYQFSVSEGYVLARESIPRDVFRSLADGMSHVTIIHNKHDPRNCGWRALVEKEANPHGCLCTQSDHAKRSPLCVIAGCLLAMLSVYFGEVASGCPMGIASVLALIIGIVAIFLLTWWLTHRAPPRGGLSPKHDNKVEVILNDIDHKVEHILNVIGGT